MCASRAFVVAAAVLALCGAAASASAPASAAHRSSPAALDLITGADEQSNPGEREPPRALAACILPAPVCAAEDVVDAVGGAAGDAVGEAAGWASEAVMEGVTGWVANGASWLLRQAAGLAQQTTTQRLDSRWFRERYGDMTLLSAPLVAALLLLSMIDAALRRDPHQVVRSLAAVPFAFILAAGMLAVLSLLVAATDAWSAWLLRRFDNDAREVFQGLAQATLFSGLSGRPQVPLFIVFATALVTVLCTLAVWVELLLREAAIYVAAFFVPLTFAGMVWRRTEPWLTRSVEFLVAVIVAKLPICGALALGAAAMAHSGSQAPAAAVGGVLAGAAVIGFAALAPYLLLKLFPLAREALAAGIHQRASLPPLAARAPGATPAVAMRAAMAANWSASALGVVGAAAMTGAQTATGRLRTTGAAAGSGSASSATGAAAGGQDRVGRTAAGWSGGELGSMPPRRPSAGPATADATGSSPGQPARPAPPKPRQSAASRDPRFPPAPGLSSAAAERDALAPPPAQRPPRTDDGLRPGGD